MTAVAAAGGEVLLGRAAAGVATRLGARAALGFLGPVGAAIGLAMLAYEGYELYKMYNESHSEPADGGREAALGTAIRQRRKNRRSGKRNWRMKRASVNRQRVRQNTAKRMAVWRKLNATSIP